MTAAIFPTYFLARTVVSKPWALFAASAPSPTPALAYAPFLVEEPLAYPWATLCLFLIAKALAARTRWRGSIGAARGGARRALRPRRARGPDPGLRGSRRSSSLWTSEPARRWRRTWSAWDWVGASSSRSARSSSSAPSSARTRRPGSSPPASTGTGRSSTGSGRPARSRSALGCCRWSALAALVRPRGEQWTRELKAFVALTAASVLAFGLYTATKAAYLSTVFSTVVVERNLIYLAPLLFVATALALERGRLRWWALRGTAGLRAST